MVVICPPLGYDMVVAYRGIRHLAEGLARSGMPTLRFDYHGTGDSGGSDYEPGRVKAWLASVAAAIDEAKRLTGAPRVAVVGIRLGSLLAMYAAADRSDVAAMVAWAPVATGRARVRELRAFEQLMTGDDPIPDEVPEGAVAAAGFILTRESVLAVTELEVARLPRRPAPSVLVIPRDDVPTDDTVAEALERLGARVTRAPLPGYEGMMRDAHATAVPEDAIAGIAEWLGAIPNESSVAQAPDPDPVLRDVASGAGAMGVALPGKTHAIIERPFRAHAGRLFGILTEPATPVTDSRPAIILANAGAVHRIGSNRLYVEVARALGERGFRVLRLDLGGLGDSAPAAGMPENDTYSARAVEDVAEAARALQAQCGARQIVVGGLCSGAHTAFHAGLELENIAGVVLLNPIVFYWKPTDALDVAAWMTFQQVRRYRKSVTQLETWGKLVKGQINVGRFGATMVKRARDRAAARALAITREVRRWVTTEAPGEHAPRDLGRIAERGTDVLLLFSEGDPGLDFLRLNHAADLRRLRRRKHFTFVVLKHPGHTFTAIAAQRAVIGTIVTHLVDRFG